MESITSTELILYCSAVIIPFIIYFGFYIYLLKSGELRNSGMSNARFKLMIKFRDWKKVQEDEEDYLNSLNSLGYVEWWTVENDKKQMIPTAKLTPIARRIIDREDIRRNHPFLVYNLRIFYAIFG